MKSTLPCSSVGNAVLSTALVSIFAVSMPSCVRKKNRVSHVTDTATMESLLGEGTPTRLALDELSSLDFSQTDVNKFVADGTLIPEINSQNLQFSKELFQSLNVGATVGLGMTALDDGRVVRRDAYKLNASLAASPALANWSSNVGVSSNSSLEYYRIFANKAKAVLAKPFLFHALPLTATKALGMATGDIAVIPTDSQISFDVNNQFLQKAWQLDRAVGQFIKAGLQGSFAASGQGMLLAQAHVHTYVVRLPGSLVRVRTTLGDDLDAHAGASVAAGNTLSTLFLPFSKVHRISEINRVTGPDLVKARSKVDQIQSVNRDVQLVLPEALKLLVQSQKGAAQGASQIVDVVASVGAQIDEAAELSGKFLTRAQEIEDKTNQRVNAEIDKINGPLAKVNKVIDSVTKVTNSTLDLSSGVELGADFNRKSRLLTDYIFDLNTPEGKVAYDHAVSGRALWLGQVPGWLAARQKKTPHLLDFTMAERIARLDQVLSPEKRRVSRISYTGTRVEQKSLALNFKFAFASVGFQEDWKKNRLFARASDGSETGYYGALWKFNVNSSIKQEAFEENKSSGFLLPTDASGNATGLAGYWYNWKTTYAPSASSLNQAFIKVLNELGTLGVRIGIPSLYKGESENRHSADLRILVDESGLQRFFDPLVTTRHLMWQAISHTAQTYDNTFGLPYKGGAQMPVGMQGSPEEADCLTVGKAWGMGYCEFFQNTFLADLAKVQTGPSFLNKMLFFQKYYEMGFLANKVGSDLMVRIVLEALNLTSPKGIENDVGIKLTLTDDSSDDPDVNTDYEFGPQLGFEIIDALGM